MVLMKSCCCVCSLRAASLIILWLNVVASAAFISCCTILMLSYENYEDSISIPLIIALVVIAILLTTSLVALHGVYENKPSYLLPFIGLGFLPVGILVKLSFETKLWLFINYVDYSWSTELLCVSGTVAILAYLVMVVYSYYKQMVDENRRIRNTGGVIYSPYDPAGTAGDGRGLYPQQQSAYYPSFHGQQPHGVCPPKPLFPV